MASIPYDLIRSVDEVENLIKKYGGNYDSQRTDS